MKQHITEKQLNELSDKAKYTLWIWEKRKDYDHFDDIDGSSEVSALSIGQMIEFLDEKADRFDLGYVMASGINFDCWDDGGGMNYSDVDVSDLCDRLWEAIKQVLEER